MEKLVYNIIIIVYFATLVRQTSMSQKKTSYSSIIRKESKTSINEVQFDHSKKPHWSVCFLSVALNGVWFSDSFHTINEWFEAGRRVCSLSSEAVFPNQWKSEILPPASESAFVLLFFVQEWVESGGWKDLISSNVAIVAVWQKSKLWLFGSTFCLCLKTKRKIGLIMEITESSE